MRRLALILALCGACGAAWAQAPAYRLRLGNDQQQWFGGTGPYRLYYKSSDGTWRVDDAAGNAMLTLADTGTSGRLTLGGIDGTPIGATTASTGKFTTLDVVKGSSGRGWSPSAYTSILVESNSDPVLSLAAGANRNSEVWFGDPDNESVGRIRYQHNDDVMQFRTGNTTRLSLDAQALSFACSDGYPFRIGSQTSPRLTLAMLHNASAYNQIDLGTCFTASPNAGAAPTYTSAGSQYLDHYIYSIGDQGWRWLYAAKNTVGETFLPDVKVSIDKYGNIATVGDLAVNGDDLTSNAATFNLLNTTSTTVNLGGNAAVNIGATGKFTKVAQLFSVGADDNVNASVKLYGNNASTGAQLYIYNPADEDTTTEYYMLTADTTFKIFADATEVFSIAESGATSMGITEANITLKGGTVHTPSSTQAITAAGGITAAMLGYGITRIQGSGGAVDITANPQIADGADGQIIRLQGDSDTNTVKFDDGTGLQLAGAASCTLGKGDILCLTYDAGDDIWYEISRSDN